MFRHVVAASALLLASGLSADDGPQRPKIYGIALVRLKSSDFSKASETYSKILVLSAGTSKGKNGCTNVNNPCFVVNGSHITSATMASASPKSRPLLRAARSSRPKILKAIASALSSGALTVHSALLPVRSVRTWFTPGSLPRTFT